MGKILAEYNSKSNPRQRYHIIESVKDGKIYCDCWTWKKTRTCAHLEHFKAQVLTAIHGSVKVPDGADFELVKAIDQAIEELR